MTEPIDWLRPLDGQPVHVEVDVPGLMFDTDGWAHVDAESFGVVEFYDDGHTGHEAPPGWEARDANLSVWFDECSASTNAHGWLEFHAEGRVIASVGIWVPYPELGDDKVRVAPVREWLAAQ
jgi:hypothetical protein